MIYNLRSRVLAVLFSLMLCLGLLPATALAAGEDAPDKLYVGNQSVRNGDSTTYWITNDSGKLTRSSENDTWSVKYEPGTATLTLKGATIDGGEYSTPHYGAGIYAQCSSNQSVTLTIELIGTNTITGNYGIYVDAQQGGNVGANASLKITGDGSLEASGSSYGIAVKSGTGDASLTTNDASVKANTTSTFSYFAGVYVMSSSNATGSPELSLAVNGGSLTASGGTSSDGIQFYVGDPDATNAITSLTVTDDAIVDARTGGISATRVSTVLPTPTPTGENSSGIVFDGTEGTVYGNATLDESLTIDQGETLTIPEGSTLNTNGNLVNNGTIVNEGGTLNGEPGGTIVTVSAPAITTESLPDGTMDKPYTATLEATGNNITWSASGLPAGLTLDANTGAITGIPTTNGRFPVTVTATNSVDSASKEYTLNIKPATVPATSLKLSSESLTLQEKDNDILTATVEPTDATNKAVTWASSDNNIATVSEDGTVTAINAGTATITATAADGSGASASCEVTVTHGNMVQTPKKDATCTVDGTEGYWTCEICGKYYKDESGTIPTTPEENKIPATGHNYGEPEWNWSEDGKTCTVTFTCANDETHKETPEVKVTSAVKTPATCTEKGVTTYTAAVEFNGQTYTDTKDVADIPATGHSYENGKCTVCGAIDPNFTPEIIAGANGAWQKGTQDGLSFTSNAAFDDFIKVQVDGKDLDASNYTTKEGSTIVTLKASYLETLSVGKHTLAIVSDTGIAETEFTILAASNSDESLVQTGDNNMPLVALLSIIGAMSAVIGVVALRKSRL